MLKNAIPFPNQYPNKMQPSIQQKGSAQESANFQIFFSAEFGEIVAVEAEDGKILFKANSVAKALGYIRPADAVTKHCKGVAVLPTPTENQHGTMVLQPTKFISEADVYRLVMRSKLPSAEKFQDWVVEEVLPSIRKHGLYATPQTAEEILADPSFLIKALQELQLERVKRQQEERLRMEAETQLALAKPKADYCDIILSSFDTMTTTQIAKDYGMSAIAFNRLLKEKGVQYKQSGQWLLKQKYAGKGYVDTKTMAFDRGDGQIGIGISTVWTQKGRMFLYEHLKSFGILPWNFDESHNARATPKFFPPSIFPQSKNKKIQYA